jgi:hypothetical protein
MQSDEQPEHAARQVRVCRNVDCDLQTAVGAGKPPQSLEDVFRPIAHFIDVISKTDNAESARFLNVKVLFKRHGCSCEDQNPPTFRRYFDVSPVEPAQKSGC